MAQTGIEGSGGSAVAVEEAGRSTMPTRLEAYADQAANGATFLEQLQGFASMCERSLSLEDGPMIAAKFRDAAFVILSMEKRYADRIVAPQANDGVREAALDPEQVAAAMFAADTDDGTPTWAEWLAYTARHRSLHGKVEEYRRRSERFIRALKTTTTALVCEHGGNPEAVSVAARDVLAERRRQFEAEGWTPAHDDQHNLGEIAMAAASYAVHSAGHEGHAYGLWPWNRVYRKFGDRRRDLVKAGALILAEIDRIDRGAPSTPSQQDGETEAGR